MTQEPFYQDPEQLDAAQQAGEPMVRVDLARGKISVPVRNGDQIEYMELKAGPNWLPRAVYEESREFLDAFTIGSKNPYNPWTYDEKAHGRRAPTVKVPI